ncbi:MAG: glycosyltransferase family 4 protein [Desulfobulbaceae bacterium]|nr:glycosyltransferase family 4 protein [Desulfobulbaceae bacterium]
MRIAFYAPFKPLDHPHPSGDQIIGRSLFRWFQEQGHQVREISRLRTRWIFRHSLEMAASIFEQRRVLAELKEHPVDCWFTHHSYYKAPDLLGPFIHTNLQLPYVLFQPSYATKYRKKPVTAPGFYLNRRALLAGDCCLTNRHQDLKDLERIVARDKLFFIPPAISLQRFRRDERARTRLRRKWQAGARPVILSAAMFRNDVKSIGLARVLESCIRLQARGEEFLLVIAGDGCKRDWLEQLAYRLPKDSVRFVGQLPPEEMRDFYSAGDFFVFPGINESLGMVYLEAQACELPVVAYENGGIAGVVEQGKTGFLTELDNNAAFDGAIQRLLQDEPLRQQMGRAAVAAVQKNHDLQKNYQQIDRIIKDLVGAKQA